jgi:hypothetical protein
VLRQTRPARADDAFNFSISRGYLSKLRYAVFARSGNDRAGLKMSNRIAHFPLDILGEGSVSVLDKRSDPGRG